MGLKFQTPPTERSSLLITRDLRTTGTSLEKLQTTLLHQHQKYVYFEIDIQTRQVPACTLEQIPFPFFEKNCSVKIFRISKEHSIIFTKNNSILEEYCRDFYSQGSSFAVDVNLYQFKSYRDRATKITCIKEMVFLVLYILLFSSWKCVYFNMPLTSTILRAQYLGKLGRPAQN